MFRFRTLKTFSVPNKTSILSRMNWDIVNGRVEDVLTSLPDCVFDGVFCDPPYGISFMGERWDYDVPSVNLWREVCRTLKPGAHLLAFGSPRTIHRITTGIEDAGFEIEDSLIWLYGQGMPKGAAEKNLAPGFRSKLKPNHEPIVLARKPFSGTLKDNFAKYGTGALAIDACRIGNASVEGRYPGNVLLDETAAEMLDAQSGERKSTLTGRADPNASHANPGHNGGASWFGGGDSRVYADSGGASRFFYCAKANKRERNIGCDEPNEHPTVKPIALTTWLARLILPNSKNPTLLVPFSGVGSEVAGGLRAGWETVLGIEMESAYIPIAKRRIPALVELPHVR